MRRSAIGRWATLGLLAAAVGTGMMRKRRRAAARGRVALVTGGSRGLGLLIAEELARAGARVVICARDERELERARTRLLGFGADVTTIIADLEKGPEAERLVESVRASVGPIDILVNNAGIMEVGPHEEMDEDAFERAMALHFWAPLRLVRAVLPDMRARKRGHIVNISSIGGLIAVPHMLPYTASKFALTGLSEGLGAELAKDGIAVTTVCPGLMRTGSVRHARFKGEREREHAAFSLSAATPFTSMNAERAARRIVGACFEGEPRLVLTWQAKLAVVAHALAPNLFIRTFGWINRLLPGPTGEPEASSIPGHEIASDATPSWVTRVHDRAAARYNER